MNYNNQVKKNEENKEHFTSTGTVLGISAGTYAMIHLLIAVFALYLSFKCNKGFKFWPFVAAFCCPYIYIPYILATKGMCKDIGTSIKLE